MEKGGLALQSKNSLIKVIVKLDNMLGSFINMMAVLLLTFIFILGLAQVFWRFVLNHPIGWSEEMIRLTYVWICYLGWIIAERAGSHIRITALSNRLPREMQKWLQVLCHILTILFSILMVFYGIRLVGAGAKRTAVSFPMNYAIVYLMGPICNFLICCYEIARIAECIVIGPRDYSDKKGEEEQ